MDKPSAAIPLEREGLRADPARAFPEPREFTVFGRVDRVVERGTVWDPLAATSILDRYIPGGETGEGFREEFKKAAAGMNLEVSDDAMVLSGPAVVVHPIAVYW